MANIDNELNDPGVDPQDESSSVDQGKQTLLLQLAERTVLQAEALAQEITDRAKRASESEGIKILERSNAEAKDEARQIIEEAKDESRRIINEAKKSRADILSETKVEAESDGLKILEQAQEKQKAILASANAEKQSILGQAHKDEQEISARARAGEQEIINKAQSEAQTLVDASKAGVESIESNATTRAEFMIWQMSQNAADEIKRAVLQICNNLLPELNAIGTQQLEKFAPDPKDRGVTVDADLLAQIGLANNTAEDRLLKASTEPQNDQTPTGTNPSQGQTTDKPSGRSRAASPARSRKTS